MFLFFVFYVTWLKSPETGISHYFFNRVISMACRCSSVARDPEVVFNQHPSFFSEGELLMWRLIAHVMLRSESRSILRFTHQNICNYAQCTREVISSVWLFYYANEGRRQLVDAPVIQCKYVAVYVAFTSSNVVTLTWRFRVADAVRCQMKPHVYTRRFSTAPIDRLFNSIAFMPKWRWSKGPLQTKTLHISCHIHVLDALIDLFWW